MLTQALRRQAIFREQEKLLLHRADFPIERGVDRPQPIGDALGCVRNVARCANSNRGAPCGRDRLRDWKIDERP